MNPAVADPSGAEALSVRKALPDEAAPFRAQYPRAVWPGHPNLGATAQFWLQRHAMFREFAGTLHDAAAGFRADPADPAAFRAWLFPRLKMYFDELHGHHAVEDAHYFPVFRTADARLGRGFDILDADHHAIDRLIYQLAQSATSFDATIRSGGGIDRAGDRLVEELHTMLRGVGRHLEDEEDIVMPLILALPDIVP